MTRRMPPAAQIAFTRSWLERQGIEAQTIDVEAYIDPSLSYEENIKLFKREFKLGGGRSQKRATRDLSVAECDVAIGNYQAGFNHEVTVDACACGHPDACGDLERAGRAAKKAAKPKMTATEAAWQAARSQQRAAATKPPRTPAPSVPAILAPAPAAASGMANVPVRLGGGGIPPIPGMGAAAAPKPKRKTAAKPAAKKAATPKPKSKAKNGKTAAGITLTAAQKKRLAAKGSITIKRGGKFVTVRG